MLGDYCITKWMWQESYKEIMPKFISKNISLNYAQQGIPVIPNLAVMGLADCDLEFKCSLCQGKKDGQLF